MAIIKCPECGRQISDKAPVCPNCGVEISGKITTCPECGEVYFTEKNECPNCHGNTNNATESDNKNDLDNNRQDKTKKKSGGKTIFAVSFVIALLICGIGFYMYKDAKDTRENEEYAYAMRSQDPTVLQSYLDTYKDAPIAHRDSINVRLQAIKELDKEWTNAVASNSRHAIEEYINKHPDTPYKQEAMHKLDSLDWELCRMADTAEAYQTYLDKHNDGDHYEEAQEGLKKANSKNVSQEERLIINNVFHNFFTSINSHDEYGLTSTVADNLTLLDKEYATKSDVVELMRKLYKDDVDGMTWHLDKNYNINKREIGDNMYEYQVVFSAVQDVRYKSGDKRTNKYRINAMVDPEGKISEFKMTKIVE